MSASPRRELFAILVLAALLLTVALPFYASVARTPEAVFFGDNVFVVSQATAASPVTAALVDDLRAQPWAVAVSPEVYAFVTLRGEAVVVRGVEGEAFAALEGLDGAPTAPFLLAGHRVAARLGLAPGDVLLLPGSLRPLLLEATVDGVLPGDGALADELVVDLPRARGLAGLGPGSLTLLRVKVTDPDAFLGYLTATETEVLVGGEGRSGRVEGDRLVDDRLGSLVLTRPELARELGRNYVGSFVQHAGDSLRVAVLGLEGLTASLVVVLLGSGLVRYWLERRREVGLVLALGGGGGALLAVFGRRLLAGGLLAGAAGLLLGVAAGRLLESLGTYRLFGHVLSYPLDPVLLLAVYGLYVALLVGALGISVGFVLRQRPRDLLTAAPEPAPEAWEESA